jgi:hypothetical protein
MGAKINKKAKSNDKKLLPSIKEKEKKTDLSIHPTKVFQNRLETIHSYHQQPHPGSDKTLQIFKKTNS